MAVADGMGGHTGGKVASRTVIAIVKREFREFSADPSYDKIKIYLKTIIEKSQNEIKNISVTNPKLKSLGTTLTIVLGYYSRYAVGNIGDSRTYLIDDDGVRQITQDHTFLNQFIKQNPGKSINKESANKYGKLLTKCIDGNGDEGDIFPENDLFRLNASEILLSCSDGMIVENGMPAEEYIRKIIEESKNIEKAKDYLIKYAYDKGSRDNISVAIASKSYKPTYKTMLDQYVPVLSFFISSIVSLIIFIYFIVHLLIHVLPNNQKDTENEGVAVYELTENKMT